MSLEFQCTNLLIDQIITLPPLLQEKIINKSVKQINLKRKQDLLLQLNEYAVLVTHDVTNQLIQANKTGSSYIRPVYTHKIDDELYYILVEICENFVNSHATALIFNQNSNNDSDSNNNFDYTNSDFESDSTD